jgi:hypothetical protein
VSRLGKPVRTVHSLIPTLVVESSAIRGSPAVVRGSSAPGLGPARLRRVPEPGDKSKGKGPKLAANRRVRRPRRGRGRREHRVDGRVCAYPPGIANYIASKLGVRVLGVAATLIVDAGDLAG